MTHSDFQIIRFNWGPEKNLLKKVKVERKRRIERGKKKRKMKSFFTVITSFHKSGYLTIIPRGRVGYEMIDSQRGA